LVAALGALAFAFLAWRRASETTAGR
jgi:hypothetical protein